jgi:hypothetical protein
MTAIWFDPFTGEFGQPSEQKISQWPVVKKPESDRFAILIVKIDPKEDDSGPG